MKNPSMNLQKTTWSFAMALTFIVMFLVPSLSMSASNYYVDKGVDQSLNSSNQIASKVAVYESDYFIFSHGKPGSLLIDNQWLSEENLVKWISAQPEATGKNIRIFGCEFGKDAAGASAVAYLQDHLGVEVSASDDITGRSGDWILEVGTPFSDLELSDFDGDLQNCAGKVGGTTDTDDFDGDGYCNVDDYDDDNDGIPDIYEVTACTPSNKYTTGTASKNGTGAYTLSPTELALISDVQSGTQLSLPYSTVSSFQKLVFNYDAITISEIKIYNFLNGNVGNTSTPHVTRIGRIDLYNAQNDVVWSISNVLPVTITASSYYGIPVPNVEGVTRMELVSVYSSTNGFGFRDIFPAGCEYDTDGDGSPDKFDTDSDNDGCPDAVESNAVNPTTGYAFGDLDGRWMVIGPVGNTVGATGTAGVPLSNRNNPVGAYDANVQALECNPCLPTSSLYVDDDLDGYSNECDLDNDNDGILDTIECPGLYLYPNQPITTIDLSSAEEQADPNPTDFYGPALVADSTAFLPDGRCVSVRIDVEQVSPLVDPFFLWDLSPTDGTKLFKGRVNRKYRFRVHYFECGTNTPVEIATIFKIRDIDGEGDWNGDGVLDNPMNDVFTGNTTNDDYVAVPTGIISSYAYDDTTLIYSQTIGYQTYFFSSGVDNYNQSGYSWITTVTPTTQEVYLTYNKLDSFEFDYWTGGFGGIYMDFGAGGLPICDYDGDGIPNFLDSDSDNDGCPDALEGDSSFTFQSIGTNYQLLGGVDSRGVPIVAPTGQGEGSALDSNFNWCATITNPDMNVGFMCDSLTGDVSTNDEVLPTTVYGTVDPDTSLNPSTEVPVMNADGTYSFTSCVPGVYVFYVDVCSPGADSPCPKEVLVITVLDTTYNVNPPVANIDLGSTPMNTPITMNITENDAPGSNLGGLDVPTIVEGPKHGTATIDADGNLVYTPDPGYVGIDTVFYEVCDTFNGLDLCVTTVAIIDVIPPGVNGISATDDYYKGQRNSPIQGNAILNDIDPNGDPLTITPIVDSIIPGVGRMNLNADGTFTFIPEADFVGPVNFPYEVCDDKGLCTMATIYLLIFRDGFYGQDIDVNKFNAFAEDCNINVQWNVSRTTDALELVLQRGSRLGDFADVKTFSVPSNTSSTISYNFEDANLAVNKEYLYRLKLVDQDGSTDYSETVGAKYKCSSQSAVSVYPNPSGGFYNVEINGLADQTVYVEVYDMLGRKIFSTTNEIVNSNQTVQVDISTYAPGHYQVRVISEYGFTSATTIVKQ